jgi:hypothetical protein
MVTTGSFPKQLIKGTKMAYGKSKKMNYKKMDYKGKDSLKPGKISPRKRMAMKGGK